MGMAKDWFHVNLLNFQELLLKTNFFHDDFKHFIYIGAETLGVGTHSVNVKTDNLLNYEA